MTQNTKKIFDFISRNPGRSVKEICKGVKLSTWSIYRHMKYIGDSVAISKGKYTAVKALSGSAEVVPATPNVHLSTMNAKMISEKMASVPLKYREQMHHSLVQHFFFGYQAQALVSAIETANSILPL
jgi:hypothetical protein